MILCSKPKCLTVHTNTIHVLTGMSRHWHFHYTVTSFFKYLCFTISCYYKRSGGSWCFVSRQSSVVRPLAAKTSNLSSIPGEPAFSHSSFFCLCQHWLHSYWYHQAAKNLNSTVYATTVGCMLVCAWVLDFQMISSAPYIVARFLELCSLPHLLQLAVVSLLFPWLLFFIMMHYSY